MASVSTIELKDLIIDTNIGTYAPDDVVPDRHVLDLTFAIDPELVLIDADEMARVFDYDPLIAEIQKLAGDGHYETQERLMTRIVEACAHYNEVRSLDLFLRKSPVSATSGSLGVRLVMDAEDLERFRAAK